MRKGELFNSWESYKDNLASYWVLILESPSVSSSLIPFLKPCFLLRPLSGSTYSKNFHSILLSFTHSKLQKATILLKDNQLISNGKQRHESNKQIFVTQHPPPPRPTLSAILPREKAGEVVEKTGLAINTFQTLTRLAQHHEWQTNRHTPPKKKKKKF